MNVNITIEIHYRAFTSKCAQHGSFQSKGRKPEFIAYHWWKQIKKEMSYHAELEKVLVDGDKDITEIVNVLEKQELTNIDDN
ncbi:hypothetical protein ACIQAA_27215 [Neobacillus sp. NPDC093182]|uniref:hypothetical protein n=1 Tax=Neobacillus sp. NPDC093182 TaxID=3364297 RepID=UPI00383007DF